METNFFGPLAATRSFAPAIECNCGGAVLNVLSALSWFHPAGLGSYAASKAAAWALTDATRDELAPRGITVSALHVGYMDTDMAAGVPAGQKVAAADVAAQALHGIEAGLPEILADATSRYVKLVIDAEHARDAQRRCRPSHEHAQFGRAGDRAGETGARQAL